MTPSLDLAMLQQTARTSNRSRRMWLVLAALMVMVMALIVILVWYVHGFEAEEMEHRRVADGQWLEQAIHFHLNQLEHDVQQMAIHAPAKPTPLDHAGWLWRQPQVVLVRAWMAKNNAIPHLPGLWQQHIQAAQSNQQALSTMLELSQHLRRATYAGPMRSTPSQLSDIIWMAYPTFDQNEVSGHYILAISVTKAMQSMVPHWFEQHHTLRLLNETDTPTAATSNSSAPYLASMNLPGIDLYIEIVNHPMAMATVPRVLLALALTFLLGMIISIGALRRDMHKRQRVQALLQAQVALRTAMENSVTIGLRAWNQEGTILYVNEAFCQMVGYTAAELVGQTAPLPYWPADKTTELNEVHRHILEKGTEHGGVELQFQHRNGHLVDVLICEAPLVTTTQEHIGWMSSVMDISDRKRAQRLSNIQQEKLEASGRLVAVGEVASTLAHELNQPLGALSSFSNGLLNRLQQQNISLAELIPIVQRMAHLSDRAGAIISRVNAFARRRELSKQRINAILFLDHYLSTHHTSGAVPVHFQNRATTQALWIDADVLLLEHVLRNLVGNAIDWAPRGTKNSKTAKVQVTCHPDADQQKLCIQVADTGPGVPDEAIDHIFTAFFSTKEGGMGMGLAICRSIVEAHHGRLEVQNHCELGGVAMLVWLPLSNTMAA